MVCEGPGFRVVLLIQQLRKTSGHAFVECRVVLHWSSVWYGFVRAMCLGPGKHPTTYR